MILSVIIPLFNSEEFIGDTLNSLYRQGLAISDFEIIVINDGSTDNSIDIVERFIKRYANIKLFSQPNSGVSSARNRGLEMSCGKYVHFLDSDDMMEDNSYSMLSKLCTSSPEIIKFDSYSLLHGQKHERNKRDSIHEVFSGNTKDYVRKFGFPVSSVFYWFKRELLMNHHFHFDDFKLGEDGYFCMNVLQYSNCNIIACDNKFYIYIQHKNSAVHNNNKSHLKDVIEGAFDLIQKINGLSKECIFPYKCYEPYLNSLSEVIATHLLRGNFDYEYVKEIFNRMRKNSLLPLKRKSVATCLLNIIFSNEMLVRTVSFIHRNLYFRYFKHCN